MRVKQETNHTLKDKIVDFNYNMLPVLFIGGAIASIAWELDLPNLFGPYSEPLWLVVSSFGLSFKNPMG